MYVVKRHQERERESRGRSADPSSRTAFGVPPDCARPCKRLPYNTIHVQLRPLAVDKKNKKAANGGGSRGGSEGVKGGVPKHHQQAQCPVHASQHTRKRACMHRKTPDPVSISGFTSLGER